MLAKMHEQLKEIRMQTGLVQKAFALEMGVPLRTYENLESGRSEVRQVHLNAAKWALLMMISEDDVIGITKTPPEFREIITKAFHNMRS